MGSLTPNATYIYESEGGRIYAREFGQTERKIIGYDVGSYGTHESKYYINEINDVLKMCEADPAMKELLDRLFVLYNLKKDER